MTARTAAAIYARFSTSKQTADSIDDQLRVCRDFAKQKGLDVVLEFKDEGESGAHSQRHGFNALRSASLAPKHLRKFDYVIIADLSRLARDLWVLGRTVFEEFLPVGVRVLDRATGLASDSPAARTTFAALGIANDALLQTVREKTHVALESRAREGFSAGGGCFGYTTTRDTQNALAGRNPKSVIVIDPPAAEVVRRIFKLYIDGFGTKAIAELLNREGVRAPYDGRKNKTNGAGWGHTTVRSILVNERYVGRFVWNKRKFVHVPGKKNRRVELRPRSEWIERTRPELAIVEAEVWTRVQGRMKRRHSGGGGPGRPLGASKSGPHLLSGVLHCGVCGNAMGVVSLGKVGCLRNDSRGYSTVGCPNRMAISESAVEVAILAAIKEAIDAADQWQPIVKEVMREMHVTTFVELPEVAQLRGELEAAEGRVARLTEAVANNGASRALMEKLSAEEERVHSLKAALRSKRLPSDKVPKVSYFDVVAAFEDLAKVEGQDRAVANAKLREYLGRVVMTPQSEGPVRGYRANGAIDIFVPLTRGRENASCGGRI